LETTGDPWPVRPIKKNSRPRSSITVTTTDVVPSRIDSIMRYLATDFDSRAFSIDINRFDWERGFRLAAFFDGMALRAQSGILARQFLVAESAVNLL